MNALLDLMARLLHYQQHGEPPFAPMTFEEAKAAREKLPPDILQRYRNDHVFHAQVQRAVAEILVLVPDPNAIEDLREQIRQHAETCKESAFPLGQPDEPAAWQPIETAPAEWEVLCMNAAGKVFLATYYAGAWYDQNSGMRDPKHWAPLPETKEAK